MNARDAGLAPGAVIDDDIDARIAAIDWASVHADLDMQGAAVIPGLLAPDACRDLAALYPRDGLFRSRVVMARHGFGRGEYKYFAYPLPDVVVRLRATLYPPLANLANNWAQALGQDQRFPDTLGQYTALCHAFGTLRIFELLADRHTLSCPD